MWFPGIQKFVGVLRQWVARSRPCPELRCFSSSHYLAEKVMLWTPRQLILPMSRLHAPQEVVMRTLHVSRKRSACDVHSRTAVRAVLYLHYVCHVCVVEVKEPSRRRE